MPEGVSITHPDFGAANYVTLIVYLLGMVAIGFYCSRHIKGARGYFIADGKLNHIAVGLSLVGTYLSALTMMALSGVAFGPLDMTWTVQLPFLIFTAIVITKWVLPRYRDEGVISVYEFLEKRIHISSRLMAAICFIAFGVARMGIVLYLPALAFHIITGFDLATTIVIMGLVITLYTVIGGIEAVVYTDAIQVILFSLAAVLSIYFIFSGMGEHDFWAIAREHNKFRTFDWSLDPRKLATFWLVSQTVFETIRIYGSQQDMTQRYMTTETTKKANISVWISILAYIPLGYAFYFIGASLFVFYQANPDENVVTLAKSIADGGANKRDAIYPYFIATQLPAGLAGAVIAAIFAAAMSSIDSLLNSTSTVIVEDFYKRFSKSEISDEAALKTARILTIILGVITVGAALSFMKEDTGMQIVFNRVMSILTNGVLGLMFLAFLPIRVNKWAAAIGFLTSYACLLFLMYGDQQILGFAEGEKVSFLVRPVVCNPVCVIVALLVNAVMPKEKAPGDEGAAEEE